MVTLKNPEENSVNEQLSRKTLKSPDEERKVVKSLENPDQKHAQTVTKAEWQIIPDEITPTEETVSSPKDSNQIQPGYVKWQKQNKQDKFVARDNSLISGEKWSNRNNHIFTYIGILLFTFVVYFRPYDLIPALSGFKSMASVIAIMTILIFLASQIPTGKLLTVFSTEVKCVLFMFFSAILTMPLAKSPALAWMLFSDKFSKVALIFIIMVNALQTRSRLKGLIWLGIGAGVMVSYQAIEFYRQGVFKTEGYRVSVDYEGMFGNPNDLALHLVIFTPIAVALGIAAKNKIFKIVYFACAGLMIAGNLVTQSRGGGLGLIAVSIFLVWKLGKNKRFKVTAISLIIGLLILMFAPGNYGMRMLSIFVPGLDAVGSSEQRTELLKQSIIVTLRNPLGIGYGNFPIVGLANRETHNAYTQVSAELGWFAFIAYLILIISPFRKLSAIEREMFADKDYSWIYYLSIGIQASIFGYVVHSFFGSVAYNWFIYYPIAYAVCLRRIYQIGNSSANAEDLHKIQAL